MSITNKQQQLIDEQVNEYIKTYDKVASQYLQIRKQILSLATEAKDGITSSHHITARKLKFELDSVWESYGAYLVNMANSLEISKHVPPHYVDELNKKHEALLISKLAQTKTMKNIKEVQVPLIEEMKTLIKTFNSCLTRQGNKRFNTGESVEKARGEGNVDLLILTKDRLHELFEQFDEKIQSIVQDESNLGHPMKCLYYVDKELDSDRYLALSDDQYYFNLSRVNYQDNFLANASVAEYDELNERLVQEIGELIKQATKAKNNWNANAQKIDDIKSLLGSND